MQCQQDKCLWDMEILTLQGQIDCTKTLDIAPVE